MKYILFVALLFQLSCKKNQGINDESEEIRRYIEANRLFKTIEEAQKHLEANRKYEMVKGCKVIERTRIIESGIFIAIDPVGELLETNRVYLTILDDLVRSVVFGDTKAVKCLLDKDHDPNSRSNTFGAAKLHSALFWAIVQNFPKIVKLLIEAGADVNEKNEDGVPFLLEEAEFLKHTEVAKILKAHGAKARKPIR